MSAASNEVAAVIQADRDIAATILLRQPQGNFERVRSGGSDSFWLVKALARHRIAHSDPRPVAADTLVVLKGMLASYAGQPTPAGEAFKIIDAELEGGSVFASMPDNNLLREALEQVARPYGMLDLAVSENMHGPRGDDMLATAKLVRAALATHSPAPMALQIGDRVRVAEGAEFAADWQRMDLWVAGLAVDESGRGINVTVSEQWPIPSRHSRGYMGQTDGFIVDRTDGRPDDLTRVAHPSTQEG